MLQILDFSKDVLLLCASPVAVLLRDDKTIFVKYFIDQHHDNIFDYLHFKIENQKEANLIVQVNYQAKLSSDPSKLHLLKRRKKLNCRIFVFQTSFNKQ